MCIKGHLDLALAYGKIKKQANNAQSSTDANRGDSGKGDVVFTPQQLQHLLKMIPAENPTQVKGYETEDEL